MNSLRLVRGLISLLLTAVFAVSLHANTATVPVPRDEKWVARHKGFVELAKAGNVDVLFLGDSITDGWRKGGLAIWEERFAPLKAVNFGIGGDRTQHVLWRIENGELDGISPKVVVLMIGTNNTGFEPDKTTRRNTEAETAEGVRAIVEHLRTKLPSAKILLLAIFPRGEKDSPARAQVNAINKMIAKLKDGNHVVFLNINKRFLQPDGTLSKDIMPDLLHPNAAGYKIWAEAIQKPLAKLLKQ
ncbi:MAG TPA: platelet-activating factor acetylhydrolase IB subunit [Opitutaceae bacterium]|nr:platelet-activating factor acetylhydrolase IB subunit [Opitutaceae bacterium]